MTATGEIPINRFTLFTTYFGYLVLITFGMLRDLLAKVTGRSRYAQELNPKNNALFTGWERFYTRRLFNRIQDCWARPLVGRPSVWIELAPREFTETQRLKTEWEGVPRRVLNLGHYAQMLPF